MDLRTILRIQAHANRLANHRLHGALRALTHEEFHAPRTGFFPSLAQTLNHIYVVDLYYLGALHAEPDHGSIFERYQPIDAFDALAAHQAASDARLIAYCDALTPERCAAPVAMHRRAGRIQRDQVAHVLMHLAMHQTHHRGQAHAMLSSTDIAPPQLDEFLMPSDAQDRVADMAALGWSEQSVYAAHGT